HTRSYGDWSSDVCSSDLNKKTGDANPRRPQWDAELYLGGAVKRGLGYAELDSPLAHRSSRFHSAAGMTLVEVMLALALSGTVIEIGRASCRERVEVTVGA